MNDLTERLRAQMTPEEQRAAKVSGIALLAMVGLPILYFLAPLVLAAAFTPLGPLLVGGGIVLAGALALFAAMNETVQKIGAMAHQGYLLLFHKLWSSFFITSEDEVEVLPEPEQEEDPVQKTRAVIDRLRTKYREALEQQQRLAEFIGECEGQQRRFAAEADRQQSQALEADGRADSREAQRLVQKAAINQGHAEGFQTFLASMAQFQDNLQRMTDQLDLDITQIEGELALQSAALRGIDLREDAAEAHFGEDGQGDGVDAEAQMALIELSTQAELREAEIETRMSAAARTLTMVDIRNVAGSQRAVEQLSDTFGELRSIEFPHREAVRSTPVAESPAPPSPGDQGGSSRAARVRAALQRKQQP